MDQSHKYVDGIAEYIKSSFYAYQKRWIADQARCRVYNKSRQIGISLTVALELLIGVFLRRRKQLLISASLENTDQIREYVKLHLEKLGMMGEVVQDSERKLTFMNGLSIRFLATNWRTARGFQGDVFFDEFAFTLQDSAIWAAVVPSVTAVNGRITVFSTPKSKIDKFWKLFSANNGFSKHSTTIHDAKADGFPVDIDFLRTLFSPEEFAQAYECLPLDTTDSYIPYTLIEPCISLALREVRGYPGLYGWDGNLFTGYADDGSKLSLRYGVDIGRTRDETAIIGMYTSLTKQDVVTYINQLKRATFADQKTALRALLQSEHVSSMGIDRGGIGMNLAEDLQFAFPSKVKGYNFAPAVKERLAKDLKRAFEDCKIVIPNNPDLISQILSIQRKATKTNVFSYDTTRNEAGHHGDKFWALAMANDMTSGKYVINDVRSY